MEVPGLSADAAVVASRSSGDVASIVERANTQLDELIAGSNPARRTLTEALAGAVAAHPERVFLVTDGLEWTYATFELRVAQIAAALRDRGVTAGSRVLLMLPNGSDFVVTWFACARLNAVQVPVNTAYKGLLLEHVVDNSRARVAVVAPEYVERFDRSATPFDVIEHLITTGESRDVAPTLASVVDLNRPGLEAMHADPSDPSAILYSSGTTGPSKGILLSHHYFWFHAHRIRLQTHVQPGDRLYTCLPLFHANAQVLSVAAALVSGATVVIDDRFSASRFWDRMRETGATRFNYIGGMIPILMKQPPTDQDRDHQVRIALGAAAPTELYEAFQDRFGLRLVESYGQTENCVALTNPADATRVGSVGLPVCGFDVDVVDDQDRPVPVDAPGELVFRPRYPNIMIDGYHRMPDAMVEATRNLWFHTGDLMRRDADGYFYFIDRKKDAIRRRGENISAYEVELVVNSHPAVLESAAYAVPSDVGEDEVMVAVVLKPGETLDPLDLIKHCEPRMPYFAVPRYVDIRSELPKTPTHRVEKYRLREAGVQASTWDREATGYQLKR
jgi:crotonobetaine/carnitine-CoA ligase